jgi:hypothetical protein
LTERNPVWTFSIGESVSIWKHKATTPFAPVGTDVEVIPLLKFVKHFLCVENPPPQSDSPTVKCLWISEEPLTTGCTCTPGILLTLPVTTTTLVKNLELLFELSIICIKVLEDFLRVTDR